MDQPCYKCRETLSEGIPFCPHCGAPQIRVLIAEPQAEAMLPLAAGAAAVSAPPSSLHVEMPTLWSVGFRPCALAALTATLLMSLGLNPFVAMLAVGFLAVFLFRQRNSGTSIKVGLGVRLGAISGLLWFAMSSILEATAVLLLHEGGEIRGQLVEKINQVAAQTRDPQALAMFDRFKTPAGLEYLMVFGVIFAFLASIVLGAVGGALGGSLLGRRKD
jgi:hypothetical protein